jgi:hypothetical protein
VLDLSRIEAGRQELSSRQIVLQDLFHSIIQLSCNDFIEKPMELESLLNALERHAGIHWLTEAAKPRQPPLPLVLPPPEILQNLQSLAEQGEVAELSALLQQLQKNPE